MNKIRALLYPTDSNEIVIGSDVSLLFLIEDEEGRRVATSRSSTVTAVLSRYGTALYTPETSALATTTGADWANGVIIASVSDTVTATLTVGLADVQLTITDGTEARIYRVPNAYRVSAALTPFS